MSGKLVIKTALLIGLLYFYIFNPIFIPLNLLGSVKIVLLIALIGLLFSSRSFLYLNLFANEFLFLILLVAYTSLVIIFGDGSASSMPYRQIVWFVECFFVPVFFVIYFEDVLEKVGFDTVIFIVSLIAGLITLYLILNPAVNLTVRSSLIQDSLDSLDKPEYFRGFTIAESSSFIYGIVQGIVCSICLMFFHRSIFFIIPAVILIIAILFNARTGLFVVAVSLIFFIIEGRVRLKHIIILVSLVLIGSLFFMTSSFYINNEDSFKWIFGAFTSTQNIDLTDENSNYSFLYNMLFIPDSLAGILFGEGRMAKNAYGGSDIGFISHLFVGGILLLFIQLVFLYHMFVRSLSTSDKKVLTYIFYSALLIANFKGEAFFVPSGFSRLITFHYVLFIIRQKVIEINQPLSLRPPSAD